MVKAFNITKEIGQRIKIFRKNRRKMTQAELAKRAGISRGYMAQIEGGDLSVSIYTLHAIMRTLGLDLNWLDPGLLDKHPTGKVVASSVTEEEVAHLKTWRCLPPQWKDLFHQIINKTAAELNEVAGSPVINWQDPKGSKWNIVLTESGTRRR